MFVCVPDKAQLYCLSPQSGTNTKRLFQHLKYTGKAYTMNFQLCIYIIRVPFLPCFGYLVQLQATPRFYLTLVPVFRRGANFTRKHIACQPSLEWHSCCYLIRKQPYQNCVVCSIVKWMKKWKIFTAPHELTTVNKFSSCSMKATLLHPKCWITPKNPTASLPSVANIWK